MRLPWLSIPAPSHINGTFFSEVLARCEEVPNLKNEERKFTSVDTRENFDSSSDAIHLRSNSDNKNAPRLAVFQHSHPLEHVLNVLAISLVQRERIASASGYGVPRVLARPAIAVLAMPYTREAAASRSSRRTMSINDTR
jgi:hypothetical protein